MSVPTCKTKAAGFFLNNGIRLKYMSSIVTPLKHLTLTDLKFVEIRFSLIPLIIESPAIKIVFLGQGCASKLKTLFTEIWGFGKFALLLFELSGALIFCSAVVSDDEWLHEAGTLLLDFSVLFIWVTVTLKDLGNLLSSGEINLTDLNSLTLSKRSFVVHILPFFALCDRLNWKTWKEQ